jgi:large subunit ribosomal protein L24
MREKNRIVVEGINLRYRHRKPTQQNPQGERVRLESSINASNVMLYDEKAKKGVRKRIAKEG